MMCRLSLFFCLLFYVKLHYKLSIRKQSIEIFLKILQTWKKKGNIKGSKREKL